MDGLPLFDQRRNDVVDAAQLGRLRSKALAALAANCLVFTLRELRVVEVASELTAGALFAAITDIRRFLDFETFQFLKIRALAVAFDFAALTAKLAKLMLAGIADIG